LQPIFSYGLVTFSNTVRYIGFSIYQKIAWNADNALVGAAASRRRQFRSGVVGYVYADHGEVAVCQLPDVGAVAKGNRLSAVSVRVGTDPAEKFYWRIHASQQSAKPGKKARKKYSAYTVVRICGLGFLGRVVKIPKYRKVLGENIRTYRKNLNWSQEKLAEKAELHHNYIGDIERGEENVSIDALKRIAAALAVQLGDLVRGV
jgi:DNA-binding XRE family transcriptional regulator